MRLSPPNSLTLASVCRVICEDMISIRTANISDIDTLINLDTTEPEDKGRQAHIRSWVAALKAVVAEIDDAVVGYAVIEYTFFDQGLITMLQVAEAHRRKGVAAQLLLHLESVCRTDKLFTSTNESNGPMQKLMDAVGYSPSGTVYNLDEGDPELFYFKRITNER